MIYPKINPKAYMKNYENNYRPLTRIAKIILLGAALATSSYAESIHQTCDNEKKACCLAPGQGPSFWVSGTSCPKGMVDDSDCTLQYGCTLDKPAS